MLAAAFRLLVLVSTTIGLFLYGWQYLPLGVSEETQRLLTLGGEGALAVDFSSFALTSFHTLSIVCAVGLIRFSNWARWLFLAVYLLPIVASFLGGLVVWLPWETALFSIVTLMDGFILALAFFSALSVRFERSR